MTEQLDGVLVDNGFEFSSIPMQKCYMTMRKTHMKLIFASLTQQSIMLAILEKIISFPTSIVCNLKSLDLYCIQSLQLTVRRIHLIHVKAEWSAQRLENELLYYLNLLVFEEHQSNGSH